MNEIKDCSSDDGQCNCKTRVVTRQCLMCEDGFYGLEEKNYFGCVACQCDVGGTKGGHLAKSCDSNDGQCECKDHITGRRKNSIDDNFRNCSQKFVNTIFVKIIFLLRILFLWKKHTIETISVFNDDVLIKEEEIKN